MSTTIPKNSTSTHPMVPKTKKKFAVYKAQPGEVLKKEMEDKSKAPVTSPPGCIYTCKVKNTLNQPVSITCVYKTPSGGETNVTQFSQPMGAREFGEKFEENYALPIIRFEIADASIHTHTVNSSDLVGKPKRREWLSIVPIPESFSKKGLDFSLIIDKGERLQPTAEEK